MPSYVAVLLSSSGDPIRAAGNLLVKREAVHVEVLVTTAIRRLRDAWPV
jgi:hypothetical protein